MRLAALVLAAALAGPTFAAGGGHGGAAPKPAERSERKLTSSPAWISVEPITVAVMRQNRVKGVFLVEFGLDVEDEALRTRANEILPIMRDAWLRAMSDFAQTRVRIGRQADLDALTTRLQSTTDQLLEKPGAKVLLQQAVVRQR
jgi:flagellar basal body-associated protein FliL